MNCLWSVVLLLWVYGGRDFWCCAARVSLALGDLEGSEYTTVSGRKLHSFFGVPYAEPPVGANRFERSKPVKPWRNVRPAKEMGPSCLQFFTLIATAPDKIQGSEDCLYMNIYTPRLSKASNMPVLVYFHGGGFMYGSGNDFRPDYLVMDHDLVYVTINYRVGPFGFLSTEDEVVPGNNGLKDQTLALRWIQDHIGAFGGDKKRVTLSGNSAGGASVQFHFLSPLSRGLFHGGISSSGSPLMPWAFAEAPLLKARRLANALGCPTSPNIKMIECLKKPTGRKIVELINPLFLPWWFHPFSPFGPIVDNYTENAFMPDHPYQLLRRGEVMHAPWLANINNQEGLFTVASFITREKQNNQFDKDFLGIAPYVLDYNFTIPHNRIDIVSKIIRIFYLGTKTISLKNNREVVDMVGDRIFKSDMDLALKLQAFVSPSPVYFFTFGYRGSVSLSQMMSGTNIDLGVSHFDDIFYILFQPGINLVNSTDKAMISRLTEIWISFVENGQPPSSLATLWKPLPKNSLLTGNLKSLYIRAPDDLVLRNDFNFGNHKFWRSLGFEENSNYRMSQTQTRRTPDLNI